jgi:ATP-dependent DNA ligase
MDLFDKKGTKPMLIAEMVDPFDSDDHIYELKLDGMRCVAYFDDSSVDLRNKRDFKLLPRFPELKDIYKNIKHKCILDGELATIVDGIPVFSIVQRRSILNDPFKIELASKMNPAIFVAFDIIYSSFEHTPPGNEKAVWLDPELVCVVEYMPDESIERRQAVLKGIRDDKLPMECQVGE